MAFTGTIEFKGTKEQEEKLYAVINEHKGEEGALIPVLHKAQGIYGYLPIEVQKIIADELGMSLTEVYGVVTFYAQFSLYPKGEYNIGVCLGTACYVKGSGDILEEIKKNSNQIEKSKIICRWHDLMHRKPYRKSYAQKTPQKNTETPH